MDAPSASPYSLLFEALSSVPPSHYLLLALLTFLVFLYNFLEIHFFSDLFFTGFRGDAVSLTYHSSSNLYHSVAARCRLLHGRYLSTPWISSPHLQTAFLSFFGRAPDITYKRHLFRTPDGGTIALDWLTDSDVVEGVTHVNDTTLNCDKTPIVVVIPGLTSDSSAAYIKHLAFKIVRKGWRVVVCNHRGLGGISITSDCFYNAGWTEDLRTVIDQIHSQYPEAPLFSVGTSIGSNILVKYLGEDGVNTPIVGAAAVCCPWDLLICDRFINRRPVQKFYDRVLTVGLQGYAQLISQYPAGSRRIPQYPAGPSLQDPTGPRSTPQYPTRPASRIPQYPAGPSLQDPTGPRRIPQDHPAGSRSTPLAGSHRTPQYPAGSRSIPQDPAGSCRILQDPAGSRSTQQNPACRIPQDPTVSRSTPQDPACSISQYPTGPSSIPQDQPAGSRSIPQDPTCRIPHPDRSSKHLSTT